MTKDDFIFNLKRCGCLYKDGNTYYEENELIECFEDVGAFNQSSITPQESCSNCCNGNQIEKAKLCQKSYLAGMEHKQVPKDGHWINIINKDLHDYRTGNKLCFECSECRSQYTYKSNYCSNCGAKMESEDEE